MASLPAHSLSKEHSPQVHPLKTPLALRPFRTALLDTNYSQWFGTKKKYHSHSLKKKKGVWLLKSLRMNHFILSTRQNPEWENRKVFQEKLRKTGELLLSSFEKLVEKRTIVTIVSQFQIQSSPLFTSDVFPSLCLSGLCEYFRIRPTYVWGSPSMTISALFLPIGDFFFFLLNSRKR